MHIALSFKIISMGMTLRHCVLLLVVGEIFDDLQSRRTSWLGTARATEKSSVRLKFHARSFFYGMQEKTGDDDTKNENYEEQLTVASFHRIIST
jgi:hypothetical protein